jgi:predicted ribosome quality control (RQC) complex YloA/Tae2 family protein
MIITLDTKRNVEQNAAMYYEAAKKAKKKLRGAREALARAERELEAELERKGKKEGVLESGMAGKPGGRAAKRGKKPEWFEKLRWFVSSEGFLCVGGRDATTNEIVIKKHMQPDDIVFHTEMAGSPFFLVKTGSQDGKEPGEATIREAAIATASFSRAWKLGVAYAEVYHVRPEQVTKSAMPGEYVPKGAFMIYGKKNMMNAELKLAVGIDAEGRLMCGPVAALEKNCRDDVKILQGNGRASDAAKIIEKKLGLKNSADEIIRALPSGGFKVEN